MPSGSTFVIHFQVNEGCDGSPTDALEVTIPESVGNPIPEAVPGWVVETEPAATEGQESADAEPRTSLVRWTGGPLEDGQFLEFGLRLRFPDEPGAVLEFPVVQRCGPELEQAWTGTADEEFPVPTVVLAERLSERDLIALNASLDELVTEVKDLQTQIGDVDAANLRSRVTDERVGHRGDREAPRQVGRAHQRPGGGTRRGRRRSAWWTCCSACWRPRLKTAPHMSHPVRIGHTVDGAGRRRRHRVGSSPEGGPSSQGWLG